MAGRGRFNSNVFFILPECGGNITNLENGAIISPNYPEKYADSSSGGSHQCHWFIHVKPRHKILLYFEEFEVEGKPNGNGLYFLESQIFFPQHNFFLFRSRLSCRHFEGVAVEGARQDSPGAVRRQPRTQFANFIRNQRYETIVRLKAEYFLFPRIKIFFSSQFLDRGQGRGCQRFQGHLDGDQGGLKLPGVLMLLLLLLHLGETQVQRGQQLRTKRQVRRNRL